jgi:hypothetical protein
VPARAPIKEACDARKLGVFATLTAVIGAGLLGLSLIPASSQQSTTIKVYETEGSGYEKFVDVAHKGFGGGDYIVAEHPLYRTGTKKKVGRDSEQITIIKRVGKQDAQFRVAATFLFGGGKIEAAGFSTFGNVAKGAPFAITGGTGAYEGATGTVVAREGKHRTFFTITVQ